MLATRLLALALTVQSIPLASAAPLAVVTRDGQAHVAAAALEREAGIVIKRLPGGDSRSEFVACGADLCAPLKGVTTDGDELLVPVAGLSHALNLTANFDDSRRHLTFSTSRRESDSTAGAARVGNLAPNLRLTKLDGTTVTLDELRGQRVLINSWASW
jgi:hypothetical protein